MQVDRIISSEIIQMIVAKSRNADLELFGNGRNVRAFTFISESNPAFDLLPGLKCVAPILASSNITETISDLAELIKKSMRFSGERTILDEKIAGRP